MGLRGGFDLAWLILFVHGYWRWGMGAYTGSRKVAALGYAALGQAQNAYLPRVNCAFSPATALLSLRSLRFHAACSVDAVAYMTPLD
jgi:hypothetical protein